MCKLNEYISTLNQDAVLRNVVKYKELKIYGLVYYTNDSNLTTIREQVPDLRFFHIDKKYNGAYYVTDPNSW